MEIVPSEETFIKTTFFKDIKPGQCFRAAGGSASVVYVKTNNDSNSNHRIEDDTNCVCLDNGRKDHKNGNQRIYLFKDVQLHLNESFDYE